MSERIVVTPTSHRFIDLADQPFGLLVAKSYAGNRHWNCMCTCGSETVVRSDALKSGNTSSCGCLAGSANGLSHTAEYHSWIAMRRRCLNEADPAYKIYGGRGIIVCERWLRFFENFLADMGPKPSPKHSIDRIDNDGDYCPENCRWATRKEQQRNTSRNRLLTFRGETKTVVEWAETLGLSATTIRVRLLRGRSTQEALACPKNTGGRCHKSKR